MIRLNMKAEPEWLDIADGVRLKVVPPTTAIMIAARNDPALRELAKDAHREEYSLPFSKAVARRAVQDWEGIGDADGNPVPPTPEGIDALLDIWPIFEAFQAHYMAKAVLLDLEKNGFAPLPNGTTAGAKNTAGPAKKPARNAPTKKTSRKR